VRPTAQHGFTLLLVLLLLLVGAVSMYLAARNPVAQHQARAADRSTRAMNEAVRALRAYALADGYRNPGSPPAPGQVRPGSLPCPDADDDGSADLFAGNDCPADVGRLPYRTLDREPLRDASHEPLWYALDPAYRDNDAAEPVNPIGGGALTVDGESDFVAVVIAPGPALAGQGGRPGTNPADYLEGENADGDTVFTDCIAQSNCNDRVVGIRVDYLFDPVQRRVLGEIARGLRSYFTANGFLPYAAPFGDTVCNDGLAYGQLPIAAGAGCSVPELDTSTLPQWITDNGWLPLVYYHVDAQCVASSPGCTGGSLALGNATGLDVVLAGSGRALPGQMRGVGGTIDDYLEDPDNRDGPVDMSYVDPAVSGNDNDALRGIVLP